MILECYPQKVISPPKKVIFTTQRSDCISQMGDGFLPEEVILIKQILGYADYLKLTNTEQKELNIEHRRY